MDPAMYSETNSFKNGIKRIPEIIAEKKPLFSFEVFPPKTAKGLKNLFHTIEELAALEPDYISVTYGAGGSTSRSTLEIIERIQKQFGITCMHHFTLVNQTEEDLEAHIEKMVRAGVKNVLALRGDPPQESGKFQKIEGGFEYCHELIDTVRRTAGDEIGIGTAGFPDVHVDCPCAELDSEYLRIKLDHGAQFVVTQLFFGENTYQEYRTRLAEKGACAPVIPGVLPITDYNRLVSFAETCGAYICEQVHRIFKPIAADLEETVKRGTEFSIEQCSRLLAQGAEGIHFYSLNKTEPVRTIWKALLDR